MTVASLPVLPRERIHSLDVLRGFAVLGILVMNIQSYSMIGAAYLNPTALGPLSRADWLAWLAGHVFADRKFVSIFSMLFGAGIVIFTTRAEARGDSPRRLHYRRMAWLLLIGLAHAYLFWSGDILTAYALCGMLLYPLRRLPPRRLLLLGLGAVALCTAFYILSNWSMPFWQPEQIAELEQQHWLPPVDVRNHDTEIFRGDWLTRVRECFPSTLFYQTAFFLMYTLWRAGGLMLVGMALYKWGVLSAERGTAFYRRTILAGLFIGIPIIGYGVLRNAQAGWAVRYSFFLGRQFNEWGSIPLALAYVGAVMLACRANAATWLTSRLAAVGRMAFTNYIMQTLICTTLFYGHGLGLFGRVSRSQQWGIVVGIWVVQLAYSPWWLTHFRFGPLEWLWRSLTYGRRQPFRRPASATAL